MRYHSLKALIVLGVALPRALDAQITARAVESTPLPWATADSITDLRQRDPAEGAPASERTTVKVLRDHDALYVQIRAWDSDVVHIRSMQLRRDADLSSDDNVTTTPLSTIS